MKNLMVFVAALLISMCILSEAMKKIGQYKAVYDVVYPCENQGTNEAELDIHVYRSQDRNKRTFLYKGSITWPEGADNAQLEVVLMKKGSTDWEFFSAIPPIEFCKGMAIFDNIYIDLCKASNIPPDCPPRTKKLRFADWNIESGIKLPVMEYGHYKMNISLIKQNKMFMCVEAILDIVEQEVSLPDALNFG